MNRLPPWRRGLGAMLPLAAGVLGGQAIHHPSLIAPAVATGVISAVLWVANARRIWRER
jgi:hypothetical protein